MPAASSQPIGSKARYVRCFDVPMAVRGASSCSTSLPCRSTLEGTCAAVNRIKVSRVKTPEGDRALCSGNCISCVRRPLAWSHSGPSRDSVVVID